MMLAGVTTSTLGRRTCTSLLTVGGEHACSGSRRTTTMIVAAAATATGRRAFSVSPAHALPQPPAGFFARPTADVQHSKSVPQTTTKRVGAGEAATVAKPHAPANVPSTQAPNYPTTWSASQNPRLEAMRGPRFEQMTMDLQPQPLSAMEMIQREPIRLTTKRVIECDGGDGPLGHPRVFINLDKPGPKACPYCGLRYERSVEHH